MEEREEIITLVDEDGGKLDFLVLDYFKVGDLDYAVLLPFDKKGSEEDNEGYDLLEEDLDDIETNGDAVIFRVIKGNNGETSLHVIEDDEEWDEVAKIAYARFCDEEDDEPNEIEE